MKFADLLTKTAVVELTHPVSGEPLGVKVHLAPDESPKLKAFVREQMLNYPADLSEEDRTDAVKLTTYVDKIIAIERAILGQRIVKIDGLDEDGIDFAEFAEKLPSEYIEQLKTFIADRNNFFR